MPFLKNPLNLPFQKVICILQCAINDFMAGRHPGVGDGAGCDYRQRVGGLGDDGTILS